MAQPYDLVVIGAGSGGLAVSKRAVGHGATVAILEGDRVGGTCVIRGCVPKKLLVYGSAYRQILDHAPSHGWDLGAVQLSSARLFDNVRREVDRLNSRHEDLLASAGVELIREWGRFVDAHSVAAGDRLLQAERVVIACGGRPNLPDIPGAELAWVSDDLFELPQAPDSIVIVGGGYIACEFACILAGLGCSVTQVVRRDSILRGFDRALVAEVQAGMEAMGIGFRFRAQLRGITAVAAGRRITLDDGSHVDAEGVLLATGRHPNLEPLDLARAGVDSRAGRIPVDANQTTNIPHIFAIGDVTDRINLTPVAIDEGRCLADTLFANRPRRTNHSLVASAVFTQPELATVGLSEEAAAALHGREAIRIHRARFRSMANALAKAGPFCLLKLVVEKASDRVLGCHMVGEHAAEIIQMAAIAVGMGATKADFDRTMALHPSVAEEFVTL